MTARYTVSVSVRMVDEESEIDEDFDYNSFAVYETESSVVAGRVARFLDGIITRMPEVDEDAVVEAEMSELF